MSAPVGAGRIPIRFEPVAGESFDGWLEAYAQRLLMSAIELGHALGVPPKLLRLHGANVAKGDPGLDAEQIAARACGADAAAVGALWFGLARYDRLTANRVGGQCLARVLRPMVSSRYCSKLPARERRSLAGGLAAAVVSRLSHTRDDACVRLPGPRRHSTPGRAARRASACVDDRVLAPDRRPGGPRRLPLPA